MEKCDMELDVEELTKRIEESINRISRDETEEEDLTNELPTDEPLLYSPEEIDKLISDIDGYLNSLKNYEKKDIELDLDELTKEINQKLDDLEEEPTEDNLEKTLYDLSEISSMIKEALAKVDKSKEKKRKKAMYCDMARKKNKNYYKNNKKKSTK